ncbi:pentatricopeptide repeat-containing protein At4g21705, mitochondrial-like [Impatiens glandulifera]|uniref:pentatricopeptide repeat-containing protein At4g21705, mitochondrial-like n=1 Tax=Impatiens glandulifera TaxID=253017 RepID=UPI001FB193E3|nr:pentatricopeptide repeat-containing protein At4g21705, mitochondrial-like [Impatiens glandulifera]
MFPFLLKKLTSLNLSFFNRAHSMSARQPSDLYSRISPLGDPKHSIIEHIDNWIKEGNVVSLHRFRFMIRDLRRRRRYQHALEISEWMTEISLCPISHGDRAIQLNLIGKVRGLDAAEIYFHHKLSDDEKIDKIYGSLLNCYVREGLVEKSLSLMQKMKELGYASSLSYNDIMCLYTHSNQLEKIPDVFSEMKNNGISPDSFSYRICMNSYSARSDIINMEKLLNEMENRTDIIMDWFTYSSVASSYIKAGLTDKALIYLKKIEEKADTNAVVFNYLISFYATLGQKSEVTRIWTLQKANCKKQSNRDYITMLGSLVKLKEFDEAKRTLKEWESSCHFYDIRVVNTVLIGYCQNGLIGKGEEMLEEIIKNGKRLIPNSWAIVAAAYMEEKNMKKAFECMNEALALHDENPGWRPKPRVVSNIVKWLSEENMEELDCFMNSLMKVRSVGEGSSYKRLIDASLQGGGEEEVEKILQQMEKRGIKVEQKPCNLE